MVSRAVWKTWPRDSVDNTEAEGRGFVVIEAHAQILL